MILYTLHLKRNDALLLSELGMRCWHATTIEIAICCSLESWEASSIWSSSEINLCHCQKFVGFSRILDALGMSAFWLGSEAATVACASLASTIRDG